MSLRGMKAGGLDLQQELDPVPFESGYLKPPVVGRWLLDRDQQTV